MMIQITRLLTWLSFGFLFVSLMTNCSKKIDDHQTHQLTAEHERQIGQSIDNALIEHFDQTASKNVLSAIDYPAIYNYINNCVLGLHQSDYYKDFKEDHPLANSAPIIRVLQDSGNTGAFTAPSGYIYLYTDLLRAVDSDAQFMAILSLLIICSAYKYDLNKLEHHFSRNFLFDLALGLNLNNAPAPRNGTDLHAVLEQLEDHPYQIHRVEKADCDVEPILCELDYDLRSYSAFYQNNQHLQWLSLFPRAMDANSYSNHLYYLHNNDPGCDGQTIVGDYQSFKLLLP